MIVDAHNHPSWYGYNLEKFVANMDENRIDLAWLLSWESPRGEWNPVETHYFPDANDLGPIPFESCRDFAERRPGRFVLGFAPDPRRADAIDRLKAAREAYGVQVCGEVKLRMMYDNPDALRLFRFCGKEGLPVVLHIDYERETGAAYPRPSWWFGGGLDVLERVLAACPDTVFLGHAPGFWGHISGDELCEKELYPHDPILPGGRILGLLRSRQNLYCDLSAESGRNALDRDRAFARDFLEEFQDRVLFGRDRFDARHLELIESLGLSPAAREKILAGNALRLAPPDR